MTTHDDTTITQQDNSTRQDMITHDNTHDNTLMRAKFHTTAMEAETSHQEVCCSCIRIELCKIDIWELKLHAKGHDI